MFQRSGSILVLIGVIVEFLLLQFSKKEIYKDISSPMNQKERVMPLKFRLMQSMAHIYVVLGTFIWGYADLWY